MVDILTDMISLPVNEMVRLLSRSYTALIKSGSPLKRFPSVMLWGAPGVGKSQGIRQIANEIERETSKKTAVTDVRLLLFNPVDLRGIPTANAEKTLAVWLKPKIFQMDESPDTVNILFLDEISAAPPSVQAAAYQITLDRTVGEHKLPENCIVIAAGNRVTDKSVAYHMPKALANRLCHIEIACDAVNWSAWAKKSGIHSMVYGFIDYSPSMLMGFEGADTEGLAFPTPRSWEMVSNILNDVSDNVKNVFPLIVGCIGSNAANQFLLWSKVYGNIPSVEGIFKGDTVAIPTRPDVLYALSAQISEYAASHHTKDELKNAITYVAKLSPEFKSKIFTDFLSIKSIRKMLCDNLIYDDWFQRSGRSWENYGLS